MKSKKRFSFTIAKLNAVKCPPSGEPDKGGRVWVYDADEPGLAFRATETGTRSFFCAGMCKGRFRRVELAKVNEVDGGAIIDARKDVRAMMAKMRNGIDPVQEKRERIAEAAKAVATVGDLWEAYRSEHLVHTKPVTQLGFTRLYNVHLAAWKNRPLADINKVECKALHLRIGAKSQTTANRVMTLLSAMFRAKGADFGLPDRWTPTANVAHFPEQARDRVLSPEELAALLAAIDADNNELVRDYFRMLIYTGSRKGKLAEMRWQEISMQRRTWTVAGMLMKNGSPLVVNLVDDALKILDRRANTNPADSPFVFPAKALTAAQVERVRELLKAGKTTRQIAREVGVSQSAVMRAADPAFKAETARPFVGVGKAWDRIIQRAKITTRATPHDLRRTFVTNLLESGAALMHVAAAVGHRSMATTQKHYSVARQDKVADAVRAGVAAMMGEAAAAQATLDRKAG